MDSRKMAAMRSRIEAELDNGKPLVLIERMIDRLDASEEDKSSLALYAWAWGASGHAPLLPESETLNSLR